MQAGHVSYVGRRPMAAHFHWVCRSSIRGQVGAHRLAGIVDREFRKFDFTDQIIDRLGAQAMFDRLVWTRGHSLENYLMDMAQITRVMPFFTKALNAEEAVAQCVGSLNSILEVACAAGLAARELGRASLILGCMDWTVIGVAPTRVWIDCNAWRTLLSAKTTLAIADSVVESYLRWLVTVSKSDPKTVRWSCHGHIGIRVLWQSYVRWVHSTCGSASGVEMLREVQSVLSTPESIRVNAAITEWASNALVRGYDFPADAFRLVGMMI